MSAADHTGYGLRDGQLLFIRNVDSGLACGCYCAGCGKRLVAKKGHIRQHHFAHYEAGLCRGAAESALHLLAKELLAELSTFEIPQYVFDKQRKTRRGKLVRHKVLVAKGGTVVIDQVRVEQRDDGFIPDIVIESKGKLLIVEVAVTNKVARRKSRKLRQRNLPAIEIRLEPADSFLQREDLKAKLQAASSCKAWLFHPDQRTAEAAFTAMFRDEVAQARKRAAEPIVFRHLPMPHLPVDPRMASRTDWREWNRLGEEFNRRNGRYPSAEECQRLWPHLYARKAK